MIKQNVIKKLIRAIIVIVCLSFIFPSAFCLADELLTIETVLAKLEKKYSGQSFEAFFNQTTTITALDLEDAANGKVWFSHPAKMRWQYLQPRHYEFITNGKTLWFYQPQEKQVSIGNAQKAFENGVGSAFLSDFSSVRKNNTCTLESETNKAIVIKLVPKKATPKVTSIQIQISKDKFNIDQVTTWNQQNDTTHFEFKKIHFAPSHPAMFEFTPPEGITIIQEDE